MFQAEQPPLHKAGVLRAWSAHAPVAASHVINEASHLDIIRQPQLHQVLAQALASFDR